MLETVKHSKILQGSNTVVQVLGNSSSTSYLYNSEILRYSNSQFSPWRLPAARFGGHCFSSPVRFLAEQETSCIQNVATKCANELNANDFSLLAVDKSGAQDGNLLVAPIIACRDKSGNAVAPCPTASFGGGVCSNAASELIFAMSFDANGISKGLKIERRFENILDFVTQTRYSY